MKRWWMKPQPEGNHCSPAEWEWTCWRTRGEHRTPESDEAVRLLEAARKGVLPLANEVRETIRHEERYGGGAATPRSRPEARRPQRQERREPERDTAKKLAEVSKRQMAAFRAQLEARRQ